MLPDETFRQESMNEPGNGVYGVMNYVSPTTRLVSTRRDLAGCDGTLEGAEFVPTTVKIHNGRRLDKTLQTHGFELLESDISFINVDFYNQKDVVQHYYPHCEDLLKTFLEESNVQVTAFDHNVRSNQGGGKTLIKEGGGATVQNPAGLVHADYTRVSAPRRLQQLGQSTPKLNDVRPSITNTSSSSVLDPVIVHEALAGKRRFSFINVWRNIAGEPVQQMPLACIDATTMSTADLRTFQIHYADRIGENYFSCPSPKHEWCYFPFIKRDEALLLKQWDSHGDMAKGKEVDSVLSTMTVHSAFMDPTSPPNAPPRESMEVRCVVIWDRQQEEIIEVE